MIRQGLHFKALLAVVLLGSLNAAASPLFDGSNPELWLLDPEEGRITGYNHGAWLETFADANYPLSGGQQALINNVAKSSRQMTDGQPAFSLAGLNSTGYQSDNPEGTEKLAISPEDGTYGGTIPVQMRVAEDQVDIGLALAWTVQAEDSGTGTVTQRSERIELTAQALASIGAQRQDGFVLVPDYLVRDRKFTVTADIVDGTSPVATAQRTYTLIASDSAGFRRDSDGDGIPDLVEAEIGMDPTSDDWLSDPDGDGWSDFDLWLREDSIDPETGLPLDTDGDGWADFDESLRGTNPEDLVEANPSNPDQPIALEGNETVESESYRQRLLRYMDFPAATRLYEVEYLISGQLMPQPAQTDMSWSSLSAVSLAGQPSYDLEGLVSKQDLVDAGLTESQVAPRRLLSQAETALAVETLPDMRLPAGMSSVIAAAHRHQPASGAGFVQAYKGWLPRSSDASPADFLATQGVGTWTTVEEWKQGFIAYLEATLVENRTRDLSIASTQQVSMLGAALGQEARLREQSNWLLLGQAEKAPPADLAVQTEAALDTLAQKVANEPGAGRNFDAIARDYEDLKALADGLQPVADWVEKRLLNPAPGERTDKAIAQALARDYDPAALDCYVIETSDPWPEGCEAVITEAERQQMEAEQQELLHRLRLFWLPGAVTRVTQDTSLTDTDADSDRDDRNNRQELLAAVGAVTLPWQSDFDGDGVNDGNDSCPRDSLDGCDGQPRAPGLLVETDVIAVEGGQALILVSLSRAVDEDVTLDYQALVADGDTAVTDDFDPVSGSLTIRAGDRVSLISVPVATDSLTEDQESFTVEVTNVTGAVLSGPGYVSVIINDYAGSPPVARVSDSILSVVERETATLDASPSTEPDGQSLSYEWRQVDGSGVSVALSGATTAVASFQAPEVLSTLELGFEVTVTDGEGLSDVASVDVTVNPANDPPVILSVPTYQMASGDVLEIPVADLKTHLEDPEGDPISPADEQAFNVSAGTLDTYDSGLLYTNVTRTEKQLSPEGIKARWVNYVSGDQLLYTEEDDQGARRAVALTVSTGGRDPLPESIVPSSDTRVFYKGPMAYIWQSGGGLLSQWRPGETPVTVEYGLGASRALVNQLSGDLYTCDFYGSGAWMKTDADTFAITNTDVPCAEGYYANGAVVGSGFCVSMGPNISCTDSTRPLQPAASLGTGSIRQMQSVEAGALVFAKEVEENGSTFHRVALLNQDLVLETLIQYPGTSDTPFGWETHRLDDGSYLIAVNSGQPEGFGERVDLYRWSGLAGDKPELLAITGESTEWSAVGDIATVDGETFWLREKDASTTALFQLDLTNQVDKELLSFTAGYTPRVLLPWNGALYYIQGSESASSDYPVCDLKRLESGATATTVLTEADCYSLLPMAESLVFTRTPFYTGEPTLHRFEEDFFLGTATFTVRFTDGVNLVDLPVEVEVTP